MTHYVPLLEFTRYWLKRRNLNGMIILTYNISLIEDGGFYSYEVTTPTYGMLLAGLSWFYEVSKKLMCFTSTTP